MAFGFVLVGIALGLTSALVALMGGAGFFTAFLVYAGMGTLGVGLAVLSVFLGQQIDRAGLALMAS